jgi:hypothetical protein
MRSSSITSAIAFKPCSPPLLLSACFVVTGKEKCVLGDSNGRHPRKYPKGNSKTIVHDTMRDLLIRMCVSAGLSVRREPKRLLPDGPDIRPGDLVVYDWTVDGIQYTTRALNFTAPMPDGGWRGLSRAKKEARSLKAGVRAVEKEQGKCDNPGEPEAQAERGITYTIQERYRRAQVHFWPIAIEVDGRWRCSASFLKFFTNVYNAAKELTEQNPQAFKQYWWKRIANECHTCPSTHRCCPSCFVSPSYWC